MKNHNIIIGCVTVALLSGCSSLRHQFGLKKTNQPELTKELQFNFALPRRTLLDANTITKLNVADKQTTSRHRYFSANGNKCRILSLKTYETACFIDGTWKKSAQIFTVKRKQ
jgi:hypothetical protein